MWRSNVVNIVVERLEKRYEESRIGSEYLNQGVNTYVNN